MEQQSIQKDQKAQKKTSFNPLEFLRLWTSVILNPKAFFENAEMYGLIKPLYFLITCIALSWAFERLWNLVYTIINGGDMVYLFRGLYITGGMCLFRIGAALIWVLLIHVSAKLMGSMGDFQTSFWSVCFSLAPVLLSFLPYGVGPVLSLYSFALLFIGIRIGEQLSEVKTVMAILLPLILFAAIGMMLGIRIG